jgi:phosphomannomutase/phosphoglucomutase
MRVEFDDGWGLVRASNTTPCLVLRFEARDELALSRIQDEFRRVMLQADPGLSLPF